MNYGLYLSASSMQVNQDRMSVLANNLANVHTTSFKKDLAAVRSRPAAPVERNMPMPYWCPVLDRMAGGLSSGGSKIDFTQGPLERTGQDFDLALEGSGFFVVEAEGQRRYTRDGRLARDSQGYLITQADGFHVLDTTGQPIRLSPGRPEVDSLGVIRAGDSTAQMAIVDFDDLSMLVKAGRNTYQPVGELVEKPAEAQVQQGLIESSGVEPTTMLVEMIKIQRQYEASANMFMQADAMLGRAVNDIARLV